MSKWFDQIETCKNIEELYDLCFDMDGHIDALTNRLKLNTYELQDFRMNLVEAETQIEKLSNIDKKESTSLKKTIAILKEEILSLKKELMKSDYSETMTCSHKSSIRTLVKDESNRTIAYEHTCTACGCVWMKRAAGYEFKNCTGSKHV